MYFPSTLIFAAGALFTLTSGLPSPAFAPGTTNPLETMYTYCPLYSANRTCQTFSKSQPGFSTCKQRNTKEAFDGMMWIESGTACRFWDNLGCAGWLYSNLFYAGKYPIADGMGVKAMMSFQCMTISDWDAAVATKGALNGAKAAVGWNGTVTPVY